MYIGENFPVQFHSMKYVWNLYISTYILRGGLLKCPKKHVKDVVCTWWHLLENLEMPHNRTYSFLVFSRIKIDLVVFPRNTPLFNVRKSSKTPCSHFRIKKSTWPILKRKNRQWNSWILGYLNYKCMTKSSFTCLFGHYLLPPV